MRCFEIIGIEFIHLVKIPFMMRSIRTNKIFVKSDLLKIPNMKYF